MVAVWNSDVLMEMDMCLQLSVGRSSLRATYLMALLQVNETYQRQRSYLNLGYDSHTNYLFISSVLLILFCFPNALFCASEACICFKT